MEKGESTEDMLSRFDEYTANWFIVMLLFEAIL